jgi:predicted acyl esterase
VQLPGGAGPYPTLVEYSGYAYARPSGGQSSIAQIALLLGYAVVDVNMRGTGCSGGAFDYFEPLQGLDGYDVIETVARQPWVAGHRVGMMGISYGGISQLFVAQYNPPSLAGITPLSVIDDTATTLYPGGILNTGFALSWAKDRVHDALPASPTGGQPWALDRIRSGDTTCRDNQALHPEAVDLLKKIDENRFYVPRVADPLAPVKFVDKIKAPVFLACQFTDEQTGGHCPALARRFTGHAPQVVHLHQRHAHRLARPVDVQPLVRLPRALRRPPRTRTCRRASERWRRRSTRPPWASLGSRCPMTRCRAGHLRGGACGVRGSAARADPVRQRRRRQRPGHAGAGFEQSFARFPLPGTSPRSWYLGTDGTLERKKARGTGADRFTWDPAARPATSFTGDTGSGPGGLWTATPTYHWEQPPAGNALAYVTPPLDQTTTVVGAGSVQAWIKASVPNVDLQVTVSEVRPDGKETFVQNGWLRTSGRKLDPRRSTLLEPVPSLREADDEPLPADRYVKISVPLYYQGHVYRAGSRIRLLISAPGGDQPVWSFSRLSPAGPTPVSLAYSRKMRSRLVLPVVQGVDVPTPLPPCPSLRGEPCRTYQPLANAPAG